MEHVNFLLVEDDDVDVATVRAGFRRSGLRGRLYTASDGAEALERLRGSDSCPAVTKPRAILLDLSLPRMNGIEFLRELRRDPELRSTLVFVLTGSELEADRLAAYDLNVAGFIRKTKLTRGIESTLNALSAYFSVIDV